MGYLNNQVQQPQVQELGGLFLSVGGGAVFYVGTTQLAAFADAGQGIATRTFANVNLALGACVAGRGDTVYVLPGYTENIGAGAWASLVNDVRIIGLGHGTNRPTFNWNASGSQIAVTTANFGLQNCQLNLASSVSVTKAIVVTGAGSLIDNNYIIVGAAGGSQVATIAVEYGTGADKAQFSNNEVNAPADAACVSCVKIVAATDRFRMFNNIMDVGMSATTNGLVTMTVAPTNVWISNNVMRNSIASSTKAFVGIAAATGQVENNRFYVTNATGGATAAGTFGNLALANNLGCASVAVTGISVGTASS